MSEIQKDNRRLAILKAAEQEFILKGYDGARTMEIAKRAGVGHPLLHYHFKTKKELFKCVVVGKMGLLREALLEDLGDDDEDFMVKLSRIIGHHCDFVWENADYLRFQIQEMEHHQELFEEVKNMANTNIRNMSEKLQPILDQACAEGKVVPIEARLLLEDILAVNLFFLTSLNTIQKLEGIKCNKAYFEKRKQENITLIIKRLTPIKEDIGSNTNF